MDEASCGLAPSHLATPAKPNHHPTLCADDLAYALDQACPDRLTNLHWFRTDWQRGGAFTATATYTTENNLASKVVIKLPVPEVELQWLRRLQSANQDLEVDDIVPTLYASGDQLAGDPIPWIIIEYLPHGPLCHQWRGKEFELLISATGRLAHATCQYPPPEALSPSTSQIHPTAPLQKDWNAILHRARQCVHQHNIDHEQRWNKALKKANRQLKGWLQTLEDRPNDQWCHGDLHLGNALTRVAPPQGPALLIDFACVHGGHWLDDAIYFEHLFWAQRKRLDGRKITSLIAKERHRYNLPVDERWPCWANIQRALLAMSTPAMLEHNGDRRHVQAALKILETNL